MPQPEPRIANPTPTIVTGVTSRLVKQEYRLFISLPKGYADSNRTYPVIYVLDGNCLFPFVRDISEMLQLSKQVPDVIIVGIGYPVDTYLDTLTLRMRDLSFFEWTDADKANIAGYPMGDTGGGSRFLEFMRTELLPFVEQTYRVDSNDRMLLGWSAGAECCFYAMFRFPELFRRLAAISPWINWDERGFTPEEARYAEAHSALPAKVFVAQEPTAPEVIANARAAGRDPVENVHSFTDTLRARHYDGFELHTRVYEEENHFSVVPIGILNALRELYR
jgi:hypothetical protein